MAASGNTSTVKFVGCILIEEEKRRLSEHKIHPKHAGVQSLLRILGPILILVGGGLLATGVLVTFVFRGGTSIFFLSFIGMPILFVGTVMTGYGFMGAVTRYAAQEVAPVGKDTFNYMAEGTQEFVSTAARSIGAGLAEGMGDAGTSEAPSIRCHKCNEANDADAKFCDACGASLEKSKACPKCEELNDPDAGFCDNCGAAFG